MWYLLLMAAVFPGTAFSQGFANIPPNPCPLVLSYYQDSDGTIFSQIKVPNDGTKVFRMEVNTSYAGLFDESNRPRLKLDLITDRDSLLQGSQLTYKLTSTRPELVPRITQIKFNGRVYCIGPGEPLTSVGVSDLWVFKETRFQSVSYFSEAAPSPIQMKPTIPPYIPPRSTTPVPWMIPYDDGAAYGKNGNLYLDIPQNDPQCGYSDKSINLITGGKDSAPNEFPWLVALYQWKGLNYEFRCTANLVDPTHVLTVASCLKFFNSDLVRKEDIMLVLGRSNLAQWADKKDVVMRTVSQVQVNQDYTQYSANGDLAVLTLSKPVDYSRAIKPICIWNNYSHISPGTYGVVAGWGKDENQQEFQVNAKKIRMPTVSEQRCLRSNDLFSKLTSEKTFCAGERNGGGPCTGDIGSPFMVEMNGRWYIRGMVSQAIVNKETSQCNTNEYVVFPDVSLYGSWILTKLKDS